MKKILVTLSAACLIAGFVHSAGADMIELKDGRVLQGEVVSDRTSDDGLAVKLFDGEGELFVRWDHLLPERASELRVRYGIDLEETDTPMMNGHELTSISNAKIVGLLLNPNDTTGPYRVKTSKGVREYPRDSIEGAARTVEVPIAEVYTPREAYTRKLEEGAPSDGRQHFNLGVYASSVGDHEMAKKHWLLAQADADFANSDDGSALGKRIADADLMMAARDAQELVATIKKLMLSNDWNQARDVTLRMKDEVTDERILKFLRFDSLERKVAKGRDEYFCKQVQLKTYKVMDDLIRKKASERRKPSLTGEEKSGTAVPGSLAAAKQWASKELPQLLWAEVGDSLGLEPVEVADFWERRSQRGSQKASYGSGTFIIARAEQPKKRDGRRAPPGSARNGGNRGPQPKKEQEPLTEEGWWNQVPDGDQRQWVTAFFVEGSGYFDIIRRDDSEKCHVCGGTGMLTTSGTSGGSESNYCSQCNGGKHSLKVIYR